MPARRVVANIVLSLDGYWQGPGGPGDMGWLMPYAVSDASRAHLAAVWEPATTVLLGRSNAEGFVEYWPAVADDESADPRDRAYGAFMRDAEKVVLSRTLQSVPWHGARVFNEPVADVIDRLVAEDGGDIVVFSSGTVIQDLLAADRVDRLGFTVFPEILGGGSRFFERGLPASRWSLASASSDSSGVTSQFYDRVRADDR